MNEIIMKNLEDEITRLLEEISNMDPLSTEYESITAIINGLYGMLHKEKELVLSDRKLDIEDDKYRKDNVIKERQLEVEIIKDQNELLNRREQRELDILNHADDKKLQLETLRDSKVWNAAKTIVEIGGIVIPVVFYGVWMNRGLEFEKEGSYTSQTFKGLFGKFKPTK